MIKILKIASLIAFLILFPFLAHTNQLKVDIASDAAILINADTGAILFEKDAYSQYCPASITKIATALYVLHKKADSLHELATAQQDAIGSITEEQKLSSNYKLPAYRMVVGGSHVGLKNGEQMSLTDLLYGLMLASGDDAANVLAQHIGGTIPKFMDDLNIYLKQVGLKNTTFLNPHGLHHPNHRTCAYDMALLTQEALKSRVFAEIVSKVRHTRPKTNKQDSSIWVQTNKLLRKGPLYYPLAIGVKTGHGSPALNTLVAAARHEGRTLIAVLLHCKDRNERFQDAIRLFDAAFKETKVERILLKSGLQKYSLQIEGSKLISSYIENSITVQYFPSEEPIIKAELVWDSVQAPIAKGERIGEIRLITSDGALIKAIPLLSAEEVTLTWWQRLF